MIREIISRHKFAIGFLCGLLVIPILAVIFWFAAFGRSMLIWQSYQTYIPGTGSQLVFYWKANHPFLAEYDRKVQVISNGHKSPQYWLQTNTGGNHHLNFYLIEIENENWVRILDEFSECVVNLKTLRGYSIGRKFGKTFIGPLTERAYWGYSWEDNKPENVEACIGEIKGTYDPRFKKPGKYIGTLDARTASLRFIPVSEKPEEHIRTQDEQAEEMDKTIEPVVPPNR
jgi:hypothetical protein